MNKQVKFDREVFENGISYTDYDQLMKSLVKEGKSTGTNQSDAYLNYTKLSERRMHRWNKTLKVTPQFQEAVNSIDFSLNILAITESWCGDAAHNLPFIAAMEKMNPQIKLKLILRDNHEEVIDSYLTNGGRSIPKIIAFTDTYEELFTWGPRPEPAQDLYVKGKALGKPYQELAAELQSYYNNDKGKTLQKEISYLLNLVQEKSLA